MPETHILFVEDNPALREAVADALRDAGMTVTAAAGADDARALIENEAFDVLVTDIHLDSRMAGLQVAQHWRERHPGLPMVYATAYPRAAVNVGALGLRDGYLVKPYRPSEVLGLIRFVLRPLAGPDAARGPASSSGVAVPAHDSQPWLAHA